MGLHTRYIHIQHRRFSHHMEDSEPTKRNVVSMTARFSPVQDVLSMLV